MVTAEQVKLADTYDERMKKIASLKGKLAAEVVQHERELELWTQHLAKREGEIRGAEGEARNAGLALRAIRAEIPGVLTRAVEQAGAELRAHAEELKFRKDEHEASRTQLERAQREKDPPRPKNEIEALVEQVATTAAGRRTAEKREGELREVLSRAESAVEAEVTRIRKAALASEKTVKAASK